MSSIKRFEEILAWQKAKAMVREIYVACADGKFSRDFGLKDQISLIGGFTSYLRRAASA